MTLLAASLAASLARRLKVLAENRKARIQSARRGAAQDLNDLLAQAGRSGAGFATTGQLVLTGLPLVCMFSLLPGCCRGGEGYSGGGRFGGITPLTAPRPGRMALA